MNNPLNLSKIFLSISLGILYSSLDCASQKLILGGDPSTYTPENIQFDDTKAAEWVNRHGANIAQKLKDDVRLVNYENIDLMFKDLNDGQTLDAYFQEKGMVDSDDLRVYVVGAVQACYDLVNPFVEAQPSKQSVPSRHDADRPGSKGHDADSAQTRREVTRALDLMRAVANQGSVSAPVSGRSSNADTASSRSSSLSSDAKPVARALDLMIAVAQNAPEAGTSSDADQGVANRSATEGADDEGADDDDDEGADDEGADVDEGADQQDAGDNDDEGADDDDDDEQGDDDQDADVAQNAPEADRSSDADEGADQQGDGSSRSVRYTARRFGDESSQGFNL